MKMLVRKKTTKRGKGQSLHHYGRTGTSLTAFYDGILIRSLVGFKDAYITGDRNLLTRLSFLLLLFWGERMHEGFLFFIFFFYFFLFFLFLFFLFFSLGWARASVHEYDTTGRRQLEAELDGNGWTW